MNILNCSQRYYIAGGSDKYFFDLGDLLVKSGDNVIPFSSSSNANSDSIYKKYFPSSVDFDSPEIKSIGSYIYNRDASSKLNLLLDEFEIDVAHLHIYYGKLTASILPVLKKRDIPMVQTLHEYKLVCPTYALLRDSKACYSCEGNRFYMCALTKCNRGSILRSLLTTIESYTSLVLGSQRSIDVFIAVSDFQRSKLIHMGADPDKIRTVHNFVDCHKYRIELDNKGYFLYFGRVEKEKGILTLLKAFLKIKKIKLVIVGEGGFLSSAMRFCKEKKMGNVEFIGHVKPHEVAEYIYGAVSVISPSECFETFGLTLVEGMSCGKPVIASRIGGMQEVVTEGEDGFFFEPGNVDQLVDRIRFMSENPVLIQKMGLNARQKVEDEFSPDTHLKKIKEIYKDII
jgi:glycosyltransferase involved in cell wall biosynthesis